MSEKEKITSTGMHGFSEHGAPGEWDMAVGEVYGYRWWKLKIDPALAGYARQFHSPGAIDARLSGANNGIWSTGKNEAQCTSAQTMIPSWEDLFAGRKPLVHEPPEYRVSCGCGFWAYFDKELDVTNVIGGMAGPNPYFTSATAMIPIFGVVKGTGRVIIGEKGFRSQYAQIIGLCVPPKAVEQLGWAYIEERKSFYAPGGCIGSTLGRALTGGPGVYYAYDEPRYQSVSKADDTERIRRIAEVEGILSRTYPSARIFSDQEALTKYFPPDKNYAPKPKPANSWWTFG
jgi:hypothetical protein